MESNLPLMSDWTLTASGLRAHPISEVHLSPKIPTGQSRNIIEGMDEACGRNRELEKVMNVIRALYFLPVMRMCGWMG